MAVLRMVGINLIYCSIIRLLRSDLLLTVSPTGFWLKASLLVLWTLECGSGVCLSGHGLELYLSDHELEPILETGVLATIHTGTTFIVKFVASKWNTDQTWEHGQRGTEVKDKYYT